MPELQRNIVNFGYRVNFKYEGMLSYSFDRIYVVTKFILPTIGDIKYLLITYDLHCNYLNVYLLDSKYPVQHLPNIKHFCSKLCHLFITIRNKLILITNQFIIFYQKKFL